MTTAGQPAGHSGWSPTGQFSPHPPLTLVVAGSAPVTREAVHDNLSDLVGLPPLDGGRPGRPAREVHPILVVTGTALDEADSLFMLRDWFRWVGIPYTLIIDGGITNGDSLYRDAEQVHQVEYEGHATAKAVGLITASRRSGREVRIVALGGAEESAVVYELVRYANAQGIAASDLSRGMHPISFIESPSEDELAEAGETYAPPADVVLSPLSPIEKAARDNDVKPSRRTTQEAAVKAPTSTPARRKPLVRDSVPLGTNAAVEDEPQPHPGVPARAVEEAPTRQLDKANLLATLDALAGTVRTLIGIVEASL